MTSPNMGCDVDGERLRRASNDGKPCLLEFEVFAGATEIQDVGIVQGFRVNGVPCDDGTPSDDVAFDTTGGTSLRYDDDAGRFIQNWKTPRTPGECLRVTMTVRGGEALAADFQLR